MPSLPQTIIGHQKQLTLLNMDIERRNLAHAYLFSGPRHIGKFTIARWFAQDILLRGLPLSDRTRTAGEIGRLIHPDFLVLDQLWMEGVSENWEEIARTSNVPQQHRSKPPKARTDTISIDDVRALQQRLHETGTLTHLCCLIRSVERMQRESATAFLKILEEPPARVMFLLTTETEAALLPTLVSRTRRMRFHSVSTDELKPLLADLSEDDASLVSHLAEGAPGKAIRLLKNPELLRREKQLHAQAKQFWQAESLVERFRWITPFSEKTDELENVLLHLGLTLREHHEPREVASWSKAYLALASGLKTNAHRGLLLEQFALATLQSDDAA